MDSNQENDDMAHKGFVVEIEVGKSHLVDQFITACEGGSNYWCKSVTPKGKGDAYEAMMNGFEAIELESGKKHLVTRAMIQKGLKLMATSYSYHFSNMMTDDGDAETGDVFLQLCVFGELIYG